MEGVLVSGTSACPESSICQLAVSFVRDSFNNVCTIKCVLNDLLEGIASVKDGWSC